MHTFNITIGNIYGQTKPIHDPYKDSLDDVLDSNIDNIVAKTIHIKLKPLRQGILITQLYTS